METGQRMPKVTVTKSGVFQVSPAEIFKSEVGRTAILKTAKLGAAVRRTSRPESGSVGDQNQEG